nr:hypothetical protein [uncultured archaeon]
MGERIGGAFVLRETTGVPSSSSSVPFKKEVPRSTPAKFNLDILISDVRVEIKILSNLS